MEIELIVGLIAGGVAVFTSLLIVGVQINFNTKNFEEEYSDKVEMIKVILKGRIDRLILDLLKSKMKDFKSEGFKNWKAVETNVFIELLNKQEHEIVNPTELDDVIETSSQLDEWSNFIVDGKNCLRNIGILIIIFGIFILLSFIVLILTEDFGLIPLIVLIGIIIITPLIASCFERRAMLKKVDETYKKVQAGRDIW